MDTEILVMYIEFLEIFIGIIVFCIGRIVVTRFCSTLLEDNLIPGRDD